MERGDWLEWGWSDKKGVGIEAARMIGGAELQVLLT